MYAKTNRRYNERDSWTNHVRSNIPHCNIKLFVCTVGMQCLYREARIKCTLRCCAYHSGGADFRKCWYIEGAFNSDMQGSKTQKMQAEYTDVRYQETFQGHNPTYDITRFKATLPGAHLTPSMPVTWNVRRNFVSLYIEVCYASVGTLTESYDTCASFRQAFSDLCRSASVQGFTADSNWPLFIVLKPVIRTSLQ